jgi:hypothetical protein
VSLQTDFYWHRKLKFKCVNNQVSFNEDCKFSVWG